MTRAVLAVASGLLLGVFGMRYAARLRREAVELHRWETLLAHLTLVLEESGSTLPEAFDRVADDSASAPDRVLRALADTLRREPLTPLNAAFDALLLPAPVGSVLSPMMARLSRGTLASRVQAVGQTRAELALLAASAGEKAEKDAHMTSVLGWTGGACLALLLI